MTIEMPFCDVLEAADHLSHEEQQELIEILNRRLVQAARSRLVTDVQEARAEFAQGKGVSATPTEIMREIME